MNANRDMYTHTHSLKKNYKKKKQSGKPNFAHRLKGTTPDLGHKTQNDLQQSNMGCSTWQTGKQQQART